MSRKLENLAEPVVVTVRRTGGFAGMRRESTISSNDLHGSDREHFLSLVRKVDPLHSGRNAPAERDRFTYTVKINEREWQIGESALSDESRTLIDHVFRFKKTAS